MNAIVTGGNKKKVKLIFTWNGRLLCTVLFFVMFEMFNGKHLYRDEKDFRESSAPDNDPIVASKVLKCAVV